MPVGYENKAGFNIWGWDEGNILFKGPGFEDGRDVTEHPELCEAIIFSCETYFKLRESRLREPVPQCRRGLKPKKSRRVTG